MSILIKVKQIYQLKVVNPKLSGNPLNFLYRLLVSLNQTYLHDILILPNI